MSLLVTQNLTIGYPNKPFPKVIQETLNLSISAGQIISLMGQNGVGKTTFIKTITGLLAPIKGTALLNGTSIAAHAPSALARKISVVLTEKPASFNLSVLELMALGRHPYSNWIGQLNQQDKNSIDQAINDTKINYLADKKLYELSDGQLQKVMIARALVQETDLIVLDEPAAHLDLANKLEVMMLLREIAQKGKAVLISTHDLQISSQLSDELWLFNFNEPVQTGIPEDLILNGTLERALYLEKYGYDMIHGSLPTSIEKLKMEVAIEAPETSYFWLKRALHRNNIGINKHSEISIRYIESNWQLTTADRSSSFGKIADLLTALKQW